jgi:hypothetical protein
MKIKGLVDEDFVNYKKPSMFISTYTCSFKCCEECGQAVCQNLPLVSQPTVEVDNVELAQRYVNNNITKAVVLGGLEVLDDVKDVFEFIRVFRRYSDDDIVIYTGYNEEEVKPYIDKLKAITSNIIIKFGRFVPDQQPHYDEVLGVKLASDNQKGVKIC